MNIQLIENQAHELLPEINRIAREAGEKIMQVYRDGFEVKTKADNSPLTAADMAAHHHIEAELNKLQPVYPVLSEESASQPFAKRAASETYWLVDPLDGTKEFINRRDSFTVNIALIHQHKPVLGVVYAPALDVLYYASLAHGSYKQQAEGPVQRIHARKMPDHPVFAGSRSHASEMLLKFLENVKAEKGEYELISIGSSLKMCLIAEGSADLYPRLGLTSEWDTAAAHCVVEEAGGKLVQTDMSPLLYNAKDSLLNPFFFAIGDNQCDWTRFLPES